MIAPAQVVIGSQVHVAHIHAGDHTSTLTGAGVELHRIRVRGNRDPLILRDLRALMTRIEPDVVHTWLSQMDIAGGLTALSLRLPWVLSERSSREAYVARFAERALRKALGSHADAAIANSHAGSALWSGTLRNQASSHVVRNALPLETIAASKPADLRTFGFDGAQPVAIFVGRLSAEKNIDLLLAVADKVCARSKAGFLICGDGPLRESVERCVHASPSRDRIKVLGHQKDVWGLLKASNAFVSTSAFEGQPNAVLEAMACGCPLVVSDIPSHREFLSVETAAIVPLASEQFVSAVLHAVSATPDVKARAEAARKSVAGLDARSAALAYMMVYEQAIRRHKRCAA